MDPSNTATYLTQQWTILNSAFENTESIQSLIVPHLILFITELTARKHKLVIWIDANEPFLSSKGDITILWYKCNFIDPIANNHGTENEQNAFILGQKQINFLFYSKLISQFTTACGKILFGHIVSVDHCGLFIDMKLAQYLRNSFIETVTNNYKLL